METVGDQLEPIMERVRSVFEITRLDKFFKIYPSVAEALAE